MICTDLNINFQDPTEHSTELLTLNGSSSPNFQSPSTVLFKHRLSQEYFTMMVPSCLSQGFYSCTNIMTKKQVGDKRIYLAYTSILLFITKGSQDRTQAGQKAGADAEAMEGCSFLAYSACSLIEPKTTSPEMVPPTRGLAPLITN